MIADEEMVPGNPDVDAIYPDADPDANPDATHTMLMRILIDFCIRIMSCAVFYCFLCSIFA